MTKEIKTFYDYEYRLAVFLKGGILWVTYGSDILKLIDETLAFKFEMPVDFYIVFIRDGYFDVNEHGCRETKFKYLYTTAMED